MRSLWQDIVAVEATLSQLQKVGDELATTTGPRDFSVASAFSAREVYLTRPEVVLNLRKP